LISDGQLSGDIEAEPMRFCLWILVAGVLVACDGYADNSSISPEQGIEQPEERPIVQIRTRPDREFSAAAQLRATTSQEKLAARLAELRDRESDLGNQAAVLHEESSDLRSRLEETEHDLEQVGADQKNVQRAIQDLEQEKLLFDRKDNLRRKMDELLFGR
jgi:hypothetical protein